MDGKTDARVDKTQAQLQAIFPPPGVSIAVEQPVAILLENGPGFSVLIARRFSNEPDDGAAFLEDCIQFRIEPDNTRTLRKFPEVMVGFDHAKTLFFASPDRGNTLFSQPSHAPYAVLEFTQSEANTIISDIEQKNDDHLFDFLRKRYSKRPGFSSPNASELHAPDDYASGKDRYPASQKFID